MDFKAVLLVIMALTILTAQAHLEDQTRVSAATDLTTGGVDVSQLRSKRQYFPGYGGGFGGGSGIAQASAIATGSGGGFPGYGGGTGVAAANAFASGNGFGFGR